MAEYECRIEQGEDWISVHGEPEQCPFRIDLADGYVMLDAGEDSTFVLESTVRSPGELNALIDVLRRLRDGQDVGEGATPGSGRLAGCRPYTRKTDDPALDGPASGDLARGGPPEPSAMDLAIRDAVAEALAYYGDVADVSHPWSPGAGMWFTEVSPHRDGAAAISLGFDGEDLLTVTVGKTWIEMFPFSQATLHRLRDFLDAVLAGQIEEVTHLDSAFAWVLTASGTMTGGSAHLPLPWRWRRPRRYQPYGELLAE